MKQLIISSDFYTSGFDFPVPQMPGAPAGTAGVFLFAFGKPYPVTDETAIAVQQAYQGYPARVQDRLTLSITPLPGEGVIEGAIAAPAAMPESVVAPATPEPLALTEEDHELIEIEVAKIDGLTIAKARPVVEATAMSDELPVELRRAYLQALIDGPGLQQGLKDFAGDLLDVLSA